MDTEPYYRAAAALDVFIRTPGYSDHPLPSDMMTAAYDALRAEDCEWPETCAAAAALCGICVAARRYEGQWLDSPAFLDQDAWVHALLAASSFDKLGFRAIA